MLNYNLSRKSLVQHLVDRIGNPLEWCFVDKALLVLFLAPMAYLPLVLVTFVQSRYPALFLSYENRAVATAGLKVHLGFLIVYGALIMVSLGIRRRRPESRFVAYATAVSIATHAAWWMCQIGHSTNPLTLLYWFLHVFLGLLLFDFRFSLCTIVSWMLVLGVQIVREQLGLTPYAPRMMGPPYTGGTISWVWMMWNLGGGGLITITMLVVFGYVVRRWRDRESKLVHLTAELREANQALQASLATLHTTQNQLVQSEKMAALGGLVAGVAHEINTPLGVAVTASSLLAEKTTNLVEQFTADNLKRSALEKYLQTASDSANMILSNLMRAVDLVRSFKQVAVDQSSEERRRFKLKEYIWDVLSSLRPKLVKTRHLVVVNCPDQLELYSYPGAFSQIITNLVMNSLIHAFENQDSGQITMEVSEQEETIVMRFSDNGQGIAPAHMEKIFDPFFTTKRSKGGSGLGLHIVYNLVTQSLGGRIDCRSVLGQGTTFTIMLPKREEGHARPE
ncbi:MAG: HAMP domain-containing sensor histidine kinase [Thermodesulfobacteriota bacterium]